MAVGDSSMVREVAILRWTGRGSFADLEESVGWALKERRVKSRVRGMGRSLVVSGPRAIDACTLFEHMPGVEWSAAGFAVDGDGELRRAASTLAVRYLKRGTKFSVMAETNRDGLSSDLAGMLTSAMLEEVKGARATSESPKVKFRAAMDGSDAVVGVEMSQGPGGVPTGREEVACLVSGGVHSSVVAWCAALSGFRVKMVHAHVGDEALRGAAKLYSELSHRMDPRWLSLVVLRGGSPAALLRRFTSRASGRVYGGFTPASPVPSFLVKRASAPLYLLPDESFGEQYLPLGLKPRLERVGWRSKGGGGYEVSSFGGRTADVSGVLDGLS